MSQRRRRHRHRREMIALAVALGVIASFVAVGWALAKAG